MADWAPVFVSLILFIFLSPGLIVQVPGRSRPVDFGNFQTSALSILVHSIIFFGFVAILLLAVRVHMYIGS